MAIKDPIELETTSRDVLQSMEMMDHEEVLFCHDKASGLRAIIAVHNTALGPALGGTRMWPYASEQEALWDVLRLSRGMTYKAAVSGLNLGGGKAVIIGDSRRHKSEHLLRRFGQFVNDLGGKYITAEDVGMTSRDMEYIRMSTPHVSGLPAHLGGSGNPSPVTAFGVYMGMKAAAKHTFGSDSLENKKILVQGCGSVGQHLVALLVKENARIWVTDIFEDKIKEVTATHNVHVADADNFYDMEMDIYSPCALGGTLNDATIPRLRCRVVAGAANNQLLDEDVHSRELMERGIVYAPDFLINAGGLINVYSEYLGNYSREAAMEQTRHIYDLTLEILQKAAANGQTTLAAAKQKAEARLRMAAQLKIPFNRD
ncbi:MAG: leucine dehydrogenase [Flavobacteriales bacterium]|nr:leucine dehydrogenase [Flavobacteriales bacterium]MDW8432223.1 Glu/Leu/Phe/Val dehydrogenase dimerization domain-containing protein [Flavobacteriales bacterium]